MDLIFTAIESDEPEPRGRDYRGILAVDDAGDVWIMATTNDCRFNDLFINGNLLADNGGSIDGDLNVGLYSCRFSPWSHQSYDGDWDTGVDAVDIQLIAAAPEEFLMKKEERK